MCEGWLFLDFRFRFEGFSEPCWDGQHWSASRFSFWRSASPGFQRRSWPPHQQPFNTQSSVGSACRGIRVCLAAFCHLPLPPPTEERWRPFDVRKRFLLTPVLTNSRPSSLFTPSATGSERSLCVFRSEQFAVLFSNTVEQKERSVLASPYGF